MLRKDKKELFMNLDLSNKLAVIEVASLLTYLSSEAAAAINGSVIRVDDGVVKSII
jgi:hypothetical protein